MNPLFKKKNVVVVGVSKDSIASHDKFAEKFKLPFMLLSDPKNEAIKKYGAWGKKMMYGKPVMGTIRSTVVVGPEGGVIEHWQRVKNAEEHPEEVLEFIRSQEQPTRHSLDDFSPLTPAQIRVPWDYLWP